MQNNKISVEITDSPNAKVVIGSSQELEAIPKEKKGFDFSYFLNCHNCGAPRELDQMKCKFCETPLISYNNVIHSNNKK